METPILEALIELMKEDHVSFHFPGHKSKNSLIEWGKYIPHIDTTETEGMDNLLEPRGIIKESQELAAKVFGAKATYYAVNGSTGSNYISMATITKPGDKVLVQRNSHKSIYNGMILNRLNPIYLYPNYNERYHILTGLYPEDIDKAIQENPDIKAVIITSPDYYGVCSDIEEIARVVHKYNKILMVDEAHGAHMVFSDKAPISALEAGADIVVHSTHKTLPSFTQTSMIHVGSDRIDLNKLRDRYTLFTTTSPSYIFTLSNEIAAAYMDGEGRDKLSHNIELIDKVIKRLNAIDRVFVFTGDKDDKTIHEKDNTKLLFRIDGIKGSRVKKILREDYNIRLEMADYYYGLALTTVMNDEDDFEKLIFAIEDIAKKAPYEELNQISIKMPTPIMRMGIHDSYYAQKEVVNLEDSIGRISATSVIPYPPGIPLIVPGEEITKDLYHHILSIMENGLEIVGLMGYNKEQIVVIE